MTAALSPSARPLTTGARALRESWSPCARHSQPGGSGRWFRALAGPSDAVRSHALHQGPHLLESSKRGGIDLERKNGRRRVATQERGAGAGQTTQDLVLRVPQRGGLARRDVKLDEHALRARG